MSGPVLKVAVVGHTNTGKTSLMRTLMRDVDFGEVSDRPAVTREVEAAVLRAGGRAALELLDTPGLEDSIGLLEHLDEIRGERRIDGIEVIREFLDGPASREGFPQEAKAVRSVLGSDVTLYVIDARDRVLGKHRDELEILGRCARPVVPVLNFVADAGANTEAWRVQLARVSMHAVAEFDTVVFSQRDEERLFEKMRSLLDERGAALETLCDDRRRQRRALVASSATLLADLLVDVASFAEPVPARRDPSSVKAMEALREAVRKREQDCVEQLLALLRFRAGDVDAEALPIENGAWGIDLFSPEALKQFGLSAGGAAATGAMVGLTADVMFAGLSLGAGTAAGAAIGGLYGVMHTHGRRLFERLRGRTELRCDEPTLRLLAARQISLIRALLRRGHAAMEAVRLSERPEEEAGRKPAAGRAEPRVAVPRVAVPRAVMRLLARARVHPRWSTIAPGGNEGRAMAAGDPDRQDAVQELGAALRIVLLESDDEAR